MRCGKTETFGTRRVYTGQSHTNLTKKVSAMTSTVISYTASAIASVIPGFLISPHDPAAIFGFLVVGACVLFAVRDYVMPRRVTRHGLRL
jgi:hypothetical protein